MLAYLVCHGIVVGPAGVPALLVAGDLVHEADLQVLTLQGQLAPDILTFLAAVTPTYATAAVPALGLRRGWPADPPRARHAGEPVQYVLLVSSAA